MEQKTLLLYFASYKGHNTNEFNKIKDYFVEKNADCVQFDQSLDFEADKAAIERLIEGRDVKIIASSLGCLSALWLCFKYYFEIVLINPLYYPEEALNEFLSQKELQNIENFKKEIEALRCKGWRINLFEAWDDKIVVGNKFISHFHENIFEHLVRSTGGHSYTHLDRDLRMMYQFLWRKEIEPKNWRELPIEEQDKLGLLPDLQTDGANKI